MATNVQMNTPLPIAPSLTLLGMTITSLIGCATLTPEPADTTPQNPTAVIVSEATMGGLMLPNARGKTAVYVRSDRRRTYNDFQFDNWLLRNTVGRFLSGTDEVLRIDRDLHWQLDNEEKTYTECPLRGCPVSTTPTTGERPTPQEPRATEPDTSSCKLTVTKNAFKSQQPGEKRSIANTEAQLFRLVWQVELKDQAGKKASNTVTFDFWNSTPTGPMKEALAVQTSFEANYSKAMLANQNVRNVINQDVYVALSALGGALGPKTENWVVSLSRELQKLKGYPMATSIQWSATDETCGAGTKPAAQAASGNPLTWITGGNKASAAPTGPLIQFSYEIKSIGLQPERDSRFEVPAKYRKSN
jgi:hypothetical protein